MLDEKKIKLVEITSEVLSLDESVIEKDYYVTEVICSISNLENECFNLVFCGGTCLAKAHKLVKRMSEDVDFKIVLKNKNAFSSKNQLLKALKKFRVLIVETLSSLSGLSIIENVARNDGRYLRVCLAYPSVFDLNNTLRTHILLEFTFSDVKLPIEDFVVNSLIQEVVAIEENFPKQTVKCISIDETAAEKWVGLTRRVAAIERQYHVDDAALIRHVYDLISVINANKLSDDFFGLVKFVIENDAAQFKNQHFEYFNNARDEILYSLHLLKNKSQWAERYRFFIENMVYDNHDFLNYDVALEKLENFSLEVLAQKKRRLGFLAGQFQIPDDFNTMYQEEIEKMFYGEK